MSVPFDEAKGDVPPSRSPSPQQPAKRSTAAFKSLPYDPSLKQRARELRRAGVLSEVLLWQRLKRGQLNGWDFDRQKIIGRYIVDFFCADVGLVVEIDGYSHDLKPEYDTKRDAYLHGLGLRVLHVQDKDVKRNIEGVIAEIEKWGNGREEGE